MSYNLPRIVLDAEDVRYETWATARKVCEEACATARKVYDETCDAAEKVYDEIWAAVWEVFFETIISQALEQLTTLQQFKELVEWAESEEAELPPFEKLPDRCKHFYRLMKLEGTA